jgi:hypothetical protein
MQRADEQSDANDEKKSSYGYEGETSERVKAVPPGVIALKKVERDDDRDHEGQSEKGEKVTCEGQQERLRTLSNNTAPSSERKRVGGRARGRMRESNPELFSM